MNEKTVVHRNHLHKLKAINLLYLRISYVVRSYTVIFSLKLFILQVSQTRSSLVDRSMIF